MTIRAIFFDAGDTLIYKWTRKADRIAYLCRQAGIELPDDPVRRHAGACVHERFFQDRHQHADAWSQAWYHRLNRTALAAMEIPGDLDALAERISAVAMTLPECWVVDPEAQPLLETLKRRGFRLAIVSNWDGSLIDVLRQTPLAGYFDAVLDSDVVGSRKPDTRIFEIACAATGVTPAEALHVGDSPGADVAGALAAGIRPVLLDALDLFGDRGVATIRTLSELAALLG